MFKNFTIPNSLFRFKRKRIEALKESEAKYRYLVEQAHVGIYIIQDNYIKYVNNKWCEMHGYTYDEIVDKVNPIDLVYFEDRNIVEQNIGKRISEGLESIDYEFRGIRKDGTTIWVKALGSLMTYQGKPALTGTLIDFTERKNMETALRKSEESLKKSEKRLRTLIDTIPDLVWLKSTDGVYLQCNRRFETYFDASEKDIVGKTDYDFLDKDLADFFQQKDLAAISTGKPSINEEEITFPDGHKEILETIKSPIYENDGNLFGVLGIGRVITDRKQAENELKDSEEFLRILLKLTPCSISLTDTNNRFILVNDGFYSINNMTGCNVIGKTPEELGFIVDASSSEFIRKEMNTKGKIENFELSTTVGDGKQTDSLFSSLLIRWKNKPLILNSSIDITEKKNTERELEKYREHLELLVQERTEELDASIEELHAINEELFNQKEELQNTINILNTTRKQLIHSEKMASLGVLSAGIAHEINNPLNFILGGYNGLKRYFEEKLKDKYAEVSLFLDAINEGVKRATQIVTSLRHYTRRDDLPMVECDMHSVIDNCLTMLQNQIKGKVEVTKHYTLKPHTIFGKEGKLHQAILNVIANAEQAIEKSGQIVIETEVVNNQFIIVIRDSGIGMKPETIEKVFDPFFTTKAPGKGTGLGLSITFNIIQEHKGNIEYESEFGTGTKAIITLPIFK